MKRLLAVFLVACTPSSSVGIYASKLENSPAVPVVGVSSVPEYDRSSWGRWIDADKDCQDTRQEVLIAESLEPVVMDEDGCRVVTGHWICPYTGKEFIGSPSTLDIDHVVSLEEAHFAGAWAWPVEKKRAFFNDLANKEHLRAVDLSANRSKGSRGPLEWVPDNPAFRCTYLRDRLRILRRWDLQYDCAFYAELLVQHCD